MKIYFHKLHYYLPKPPNTLPHLIVSLIIFHRFLARYFLIMDVSTFVHLRTCKVIYGKHKARKISGHYLLSSMVFSSGVSQAWLRVCLADSLLVGPSTISLHSGAQYYLYLFVCYQGDR